MVLRSKSLGPRMEGLGLGRKRLDQLRLRIQLHTQSMPRPQEVDAEVRSPSLAASSAHPETLSSRGARACVQQLCGIGPAAQRTQLSDVPRAPDMDMSEEALTSISIMQAP